MLGRCVLHNPQRGNEGAAGRHIDDCSTAEISRACTSAAVSRALLFHDFADRLDKKQGALDVNVEKTFKFPNIGFCYLSRALDANLRASGGQHLFLLMRECNINLTPALETA